MFINLDRKTQQSPFGTLYKDRLFPQIKYRIVQTSKNSGEIGVAITGNLKLNFKFYYTGPDQIIMLVSIYNCF